MVFVLICLTMSKLLAIKECVKLFATILGNRLLFQTVRRKGLGFVHLNAKNTLQNPWCQECELVSFKKRVFSIT